MSYKRVNPHMDDATLAAFIVRRVFEVGDEPRDKVKRIAFIGGRWPTNETDLGGLSETALITVVRKAIYDARAKSKP